MIVRELLTRLGFVADTAAVERYDAALKKTEGTARRVVNALRGAATSIAIYNEITDSIGQAFQKVTTAALAVPLAGDRMAASIAVINNELGNTEQAAEVYDKLYASVRQTGASMDDTAASFSRYQGAMAENGRSVDETIGLVTGLQAALVAAGASTAEMNSVTTQLGQALGSGTLSGDEYKSLRENLPGLVRFLRTELNMTGAEMKKAAEDQKLTTERLLDPLLKYAAQSREALAALPPTMQREWANFITTISRFAAEIDKSFRISSRLALALRWINNGIEGMRRHVSTVRDFVATLGDLRTALYAVGAMLAGFLLYKVGILGMVAAVDGLVLGMLRLMAPVLAVVAAFLVLEDIFGWLQGKQSVTGELLGPFSEFKENAQRKFDEFLAYLNGFGERVRALIVGMFPALDGLLPAFRFGEELVREFTAARDFIAGIDLFAATRREFETLGAFFSGAMEAVRGFFRSVATEGTTANAVIGAMNGLLGGLGGFAAASGVAIASALQVASTAVLAAWEALRVGVESLGATIAANAGSAVAAWDGFRATVSALASAVVDLASVVRTALGAAFDAAAGSVRRMFAGAREGIDWVAGALRNLPGVGAAVETARGLLGSGTAAAATLGPAVTPGQMGGSGAPVVVQQTNNITNNNTANANGTSGAEVAAGVGAAARTSTQRMLEDLGMAGRALGSAVPRHEAPAQ